MKMQVRWQPPSHHHRRVLEAGDFKGIPEDKGGPIEQKTAVFEAENDWTAEVTAAAGKYLLEHEPGFSEVKK